MLCDVQHISKNHIIGLQLISLYKNISYERCHSWLNFRYKTIYVIYTESMADQFSLLEAIITEIEK